MIVRATLILDLWNIIIIILVEVKCDGYSIYF